MIPSKIAKSRSHKLNSGQWATMMSISTILIGTTMVIVAWQEGWGTFKVDDN